MKILIIFLALFSSIYSFLFADSEKPPNLHLFNNHPLESREIAIVQLSFDGINTFHCGVGTVVQQTQTVFKEFNQIYKDKIHFNLYLLSGDYSPDLPEYSPETLKKNIKDCTDSGGRVELIPISITDQMFGEPKQWIELCKNGAQLCKQIINENTYTIIIAHDTAYAHLGLELNDLNLKGEIKNKHQVLWIPHATSWNYNGHTPNGLPKWPGRHYWELEAFHKAQMSNFQIGYISQTIKEDIIAPPFNVHEHSLMFYRTGILLEHYLESLPEEKVITELKKRSIPLDKRLIFSIGRANPLKGQDITLEMYRHLKMFYPDIHLVMLAPPSDFMPSYLQLLKKRISTENIEVTLIDQFDTDIAHYIYQWPKTVMVSLLSRMDTQPLTVMEARTNPKNSIILVSDPERMGKQVIDRINGFICSLKGLESLIEKPAPLEGPIGNIVNSARKILDLSDINMRNKILEAGKSLIWNEYDLRKNMIKNLTSIFEEKKVTPTSYVNHKLELLRNSVELKKLYSLHGSLVFEELPGGIANPPIAVYSKSDSQPKIPLGILKPVKENCQVEAIRLKILSDIRSEEFPHLPKIFKDVKGRFITKIGNYYYSFIEYLGRAPNPPSFEDVLKITGEFHAKLQSHPTPNLLKYSKLEEYKTRSKHFFDPWFRKFDPAIFQDPFWNDIINYGQYFDSNQFRVLYEKLPAQLIHGDNNQTNMIISQNTCNLIDFDSLRYDLRLLDLVSYFRYGGFDQYLTLTKEKKFLQTINSLYGPYGGKLTSLEESSIHTFIAFSHIEFLSWCMEKLKESAKQGNLEKREEFTEYILLYLGQLKKLAPILTQNSCFPKT